MEILNHPALVPHDAEVDHSEMKLGKGPVRHDMRTVMLGDFTKHLPDPPAKADLTAKITDLGMMANDRYGCCTCAARGHAIQQWTAECGKQIVVSDDDVLKFYSAVTGFNPNDPSTDNGAVEIEVLNYWRKNGEGFDGHPLEGYVGVHPQNIKQIKNAVYIFGLSYIGVELPATAQSQSVWDVVPNAGWSAEPGSWGGHAVTVCAYDPDYLYVITWGKIMRVTYAFFAKYCSEAYALLSKDWVDAVTTKCPTGFDLKGMECALKEVCS